jgi:hypothetical protein
MQILKTLILFLFLSFFNTTSFAENKRDCSTIDTSTGVGMYDKYKCKKGLPERKKNVLKHKLKKLNIFTKKQ